MEVRTKMKEDGDNIANLLLDIQEYSGDMNDKKKVSSSGLG